LELESRGGRLVELVDGFLKVLPMPTLFHQLIVDYLHQQFKSFVVARKLGVVAFAPCPIRLRPKTFREPDIFFLRTGRCTDPKTQPEGADLAIEVVSEDPSDRKRDLVENIGSSIRRSGELRCSFSTASSTGPVASIIPDRWRARNCSMAWKSTWPQCSRRASFHKLRRDFTAVS
jgi:hypothetical protein